MDDCRSKGVFMNRLAQYIKLARVPHWIKNVVVLLPVIFALKMGNLSAWGYAATAAAAFCFASSFAYILNDIKDRDIDRRHPAKKFRPIAAGKVSVPAAVIEACLFIIAAVLISLSISGLLTLVILSYVLLQIAYSFWLKRKALVDVICIAIGFVLRAAAGAVAIRVTISPWLFICMFTICLFMGFCKRYNEVATLGATGQAENHRHTLIDYTPDLLTHLITISAGIAIVAFLFYGLSDSTVSHIGSNYLVYTLPLVVYAVFRFAMLSMKGVYVDPTDLIIHDRPFQATIGLWGLMAFIIISYGKDINQWLGGLY